MYEARTVETPRGRPVGPFLHFSVLGDEWLPTARPPASLVFCLFPFFIITPDFIWVGRLVPMTRLLTLASFFSLLPSLSLSFTPFPCLSFSGDFIENPACRTSNCSPASYRDSSPRSRAVSCIATQGSHPHADRLAAFLLGGIWSFRQTVRAIIFQKHSSPITRNHPKSVLSLRYIIEERKDT